MAGERCCGRGTHTGVERERVNRAVNGQYTVLNRTELTLAIARLRHERKMGLQQISQHLNYSRSQVADILANLRNR